MIYTYMIIMFLPPQSSKYKTESTELFSLRANVHKYPMTKVRHIQQ